MTEPQCKPRRSLLYVPAANQRAMDKAKTLRADMLTFDLEDSAAPAAKEKARAALVAQLAGDYGARELLVRVNAIDTRWVRDDIAAVAHTRVVGVMLPKVDGPETVREAADLMEAAGASDAMTIWCMMETPLGILRAQEIAGASPRVAGFCMGLNDLGKALGARQTQDRSAFQTSLGLALLAARSHGLAAIDSVFIDLGDEAGLIAECQQGRDLGFDGKSLIHPKQLDAANRSFAPSADEIAAARDIIVAHGRATEEGKGVTVVDGRLVEAMHVAEAERLLALAAAIETQAQ
ncbi:MAG: CoA ester lyase [Alphaproteobacteria bacterium]|nr:CoA ester lyase [Alphaproteobacteria bacterium]